MTIRLYDTLTREKRDFDPLEAGKVSMYVCGPTVYNNFHIGNARTFIVFDVIRRYLEYRGFEVNYVQNFTDVDDRIINRANEEGVEADDIAETYIAEYFRDADQLGIHRATVHPRATENIDGIIAMIESLIERGHAYVVDGDVYFDIASDPEYGALSKQNLEDLEEGVRIEVDQRLKSALDFALWKNAKPGEPSWDAPWGAGRPGWHIECSVMAEKYLGKEFDIHAGGRDLVFPHHENECAQSRGAGAQFARNWLHAGHLNIQGRKMSKSLGNYKFIGDMLADYSAEVIRFFLLSAHYRKPIDFHGTALRDAKTALSRVGIFRAKAQRAAAAGQPGLDGPGPLAARAAQAIREFETAMDDNFNTAKTYAAVFDLVRDTNKWLDGEESGALTSDGLNAVLAALDTIGGVLGMFYDDPTASDSPKGEVLNGVVQILIDLRTEARATKDWATADAIRDRLVAINIALEDNADGTTWRRTE